MLSPRVIVSQNEAQIENNKAIVTVLGWAGGSERNVQKYAKIYQDKGFKTVQYTAPAYHIGWGVGKSRKVTELAAALDKLITTDPKKKLIFHLFSMNGVFTLCSLNLQYPELRIMEKCDGMFFDSCPIHNVNGDWKMIKAYSIVMQHVYDSMKINTNFITNSIYEVSKFLAIMKYVYSSIRDKTLVKTGLAKLEQVSSYHYLLKNRDLPKVLSFVYSDGDLVCDANLIHEFQEKMRENENGKRDVISTRHKDSLHVEHFRRYPKEYLAQIDEFLKKIEESRGDFNSKL